MSWQQYNPQYPENPEDSFGDNHNQLLDYFIEQKSSISMSGCGKIPADIIELAASRSFSLIGTSDPSQDQLRNAYRIASGAAFAARDPENSVISLNDFSNNFQQIINDIFGVVNDLTTDNVETIIGQIKSIDDQIINSSLGENEKSTALRCSSVSRYSAAYAVDQIVTPDSSWKTFSQEIYNHLTSRLIGYIQI